MGNCQIKSNPDGRLNFEGATSLRQESSKSVNVEYLSCENQTETKGDQDD